MAHDNKTVREVIRLYARGSEDYRKGLKTAITLLEPDAERLLAIIEVWYRHQEPDTDGEVALDDYLHRAYLLPAAEQFIDTMYPRHREELAVLLSLPEYKSLPEMYSDEREMCIDQLLRNMGYLNYVKD